MAFVFSGSTTTFSFSVCCESWFVSVQGCGSVLAESSGRFLGLPTGLWSLLLQEISLLAEKTRQGVLRVSHDEKSQLAYPYSTNKLNRAEV